jgi:hypothetical protein
MENFHTYKSLHIFTDSMEGWVLPTKWTTTMLDNESNNNGNMSKSFRTLSGSCEKLTTFPFKTCWLFFLLCLNTLI